MNIKSKLIYPALILSLTFSCGEKNSAENGLNKTEFAETAKFDTLKFTTGISAIFQDSKGNYWFGSLQEGVAMYNGKSFVYMNSNDGLQDDQIHDIQEDKEGVIWINTQQGVNSYDGKEIKIHAKADMEKSPTKFSNKSIKPLQSQWMKSENDLWFEAGNNEGVYRYDGQKLSYLDFPPHKGLSHDDKLFAVTSISK